LTGGRANGERGGFESAQNAHLFIVEVDTLRRDAGDVHGRHPEAAQIGRHQSH
jgi:hypothetical protein